MYLAPTGDQLRFGDVIKASWLYDIYLRPDAVALQADRVVGGRIQTFLVRGAAPRTQLQPPNDAIAVTADFDEPWALAFGGLRGAIVLTDDCELETLYGRTVEGEAERRPPRGRILFAAVESAPEDRIKAVKAGNVSNFPLLADGSFPKFTGGIADLGRTFTVSTQSILARPEFERLVSLDADARSALSQRWDAFAARHGPLIAAQMSTTMAKLFDANGDRDRMAELLPLAAAPREDMAAMARGVRSALTSSWTLEGPVGDLMLAAWEDGRPPGSLVDDAIRTLESVRSGADAALEALGQPAWRPTGSPPDAATPD